MLVEDTLLLQKLKNYTKKLVLKQTRLLKLIKVFEVFVVETNHNFLLNEYLEPLR